MLFCSLVPSPPPSHCNDCRELDLCRDEALQQGDWSCPCCSAPYDKGAIEGRLVAALQARLKEFSLQDLACTKCKQVGRGGGDSECGTSTRLCVRH